MLVELIYPGVERIKLHLNRDNYALPIPACIEVSAVGGEIFINGIPTESASIPWCGQDMLLTSDNSRCRIITLSDDVPESVKVEYHNFGISLIRNYVEDKIDEEILFMAFNDRDEACGINLCTFNRQIEEIKVDNRLSQIDDSIRHLVNVFHRPRLHLKIENEIKPVDTVTRIGSEAIRHLASHSEHWESRRSGGLMPARLLAQSLEDDYGIYENIAAKCLVDRLLAYALKKRDNIETVKMQFPDANSILYCGGEHVNYYHARDTLLKGYTPEEISSVKELVEEQRKQVKHIIRKLIECKDAFLYRHLKNCRRLSGPLKPTNIFMMENNYKHIYRLWSLLSSQSDEEIGFEDKDMQTKYEWFCQALLIFSLRHFNFANDDGINADVFKNGYFLGGNYSFRDWHIEVESIAIPQLGTTGFTANISMAMNHAIDVSGLVLPDNQDLVRFDYLIPHKDAWIFSKIPTGDQINAISNLVRSQANGDLGRANRFFNALRNRLKDGFLNYQKKEIKILFIPWSYRFPDSAVMIEKCLEELDQRVTRLLSEHQISAYYYLTPFRPTDYSEKASIKQLTGVLSYGSANTEVGIIAREPLRGVLPITISDINSYRRYTKAILMQLICIDREHKYCPICGQDMITNDNVHFCRDCEMKIIHTECNKCQRDFTFTKYDFSNTRVVVGDSANIQIMRNESNCGFKNITELDEEANPICPFCGQGQ